jgi:cell division protein FtsB
VPARVRPTPGSTSRRGVRSKDRSTLTLARRNRIPLALAAVFSFTILLTSFPASALLAQHRQLSAATDQLHGLQSENRALAEQEQQLNSNAAINRLARQDYQLILPGQTLYDVLPPSGKSATATPGGPVSGDPGNQPLVAPADAPDMSPDPGLSQPTTSKPGTTASGSGAAKSGTAGSVATGSAATAPTRPGFMSRVTNTLEFWK